MTDAHTTRTICPKCQSDDCNYTTEELGQAIVARVYKRTTFCNKCTYTKVSISIASHEVFRETKDPEFGGDTELEYMYLGRETFHPRR